MPQASLSALVAALQSSWSRHEFELLLATFRDAELGVVDLNQPKGARHAAPAGEIQLGMVQVRMSSRALWPLTSLSAGWPS